MRKSPREIERAVEEIANAAPDDVDDVDLTDRQAAAIRKYTLDCDHPSDLPADLEAALLEVAR